MSTLMSGFVQERRRYVVRREIVARILLGVLGLATSLLSYTASKTFTYAMIDVGGWPARLAMFLIGAISVVMLLDAVINDLLPLRFTFLVARQFRRALWMSLSLLYSLFAFLVLQAGLSVSLGTYLITYGVGCLLLAFVDAANEKAENQQWPA